MNTDTGRVYFPDEYAERQKAARTAVALDTHQAEFERALGEGKIVEVSERVALQQLAGQVAEAKRQLRERKRQLREAQEAEAGRRDPHRSATRRAL